MSKQSRRLRRRERQRTIDVGEPAPHTLDDVLREYPNGMWAAATSKGEKPKLFTTEGIRGLIAGRALHFAIEQGSRRWYSIFGERALSTVVEWRGSTVWLPAISKNEEAMRLIGTGFVAEGDQTPFWQALADRVGHAIEDRNPGGRIEWFSPKKIAVNEWGQEGEIGAAQFDRWMNQPVEVKGGIFRKPRVFRRHGAVWFELVARTCFVVQTVVGEEERQPFEGPHGRMYRVVDPVQRDETKKIG